MKVFNLTDVTTDVLEQYQMSKHTIVVGTQSIEPGSSVEVSAEEEAAARAHLAHFIAIGAVAIDECPEAYTKGKTVPAKPVEPPVEKAVDRATVLDRPASSTLPPPRRKE